MIVSSADTDKACPFIAQICLRALWTSAIDDDAQSPDDRRLMASTAVDGKASAITTP
jgi:hypothetical protein